MNSTTHMTIGGLAGGLIAAYAVSQQTATLNFEGYTIYPAAVAIAAVIGGVAPDIDMPRSVSGKFIRNILRVCFGLSIILLAIIIFAPVTSLPFVNETVRAAAGIDRTHPLALAVICVLLFFIIENAKHRGFTHTAAILLIISLPAVYMIINKPVLPWADMVISLQIGFLIGWLSHLIADTFNYPGVPWLWPLVDRHLSIMRIDSGTKEESYFRGISIAAFIIVYIIIALPVIR